MRYDFEKLDAYNLAMNFTEKVFEITEMFPQQVQYSLGDQFRRASLSIVNNIAEGSQKRGAAKRQFCNYALDSSRECVPMIRLRARRKFTDEQVSQELDEACFRIASMTYALMRSVR